MLIIYPLDQVVRILHTCIIIKSEDYMHVLLLGTCMYRWMDVVLLLIDRWWYQIYNLDFISFLNFSNVFLFLLNRGCDGIVWRETS